MWNALTNRRFNMALSSIIVIVAVGIIASVAFVWKKRSDIISKLEQASDKFDEAVADLKEEVEEAEVKVDAAVEQVEEEVKTLIDKLPSKSKLLSMTKAQLAEFAQQLGIELDKRKTKEVMIAELKEQHKLANK